MGRKRERNQPGPPLNVSTVTKSAKAKQIWQKTGKGFMTPNKEFQCKKCDKTFTQEATSNKKNRKQICPKRHWKILLS